MDLTVGNLNMETETLIGQTNDQRVIVNGTNGSVNRTPSDSLPFTFRVVVCIILWYIFSCMTLFLNKHILTTEGGDPTLLGAFQLCMCACGGYFHMKVPIGLTTHHIQMTSSKRIADRRSLITWSNFSRGLILVGSLRYSTLLLGLIALWFVPVSFAETVKSSAPVFTVIISRILLGERTPNLVNLSLVPVMGGLALCSAYELSFTVIGFIASLATNLSECLQNVYSKKLLTCERYEPAQLQFYTSAASMIVQLPCVLLLVNWSQVITALSTDSNIVLLFILDGVSFHCQSMTEYILLTYISPVTHSVANTTKRALLIWLSVVTFGNEITTFSWIGTAIVIIGVGLYSKAREISATKAHQPPTEFYNDCHDI